MNLFCKWIVLWLTDVRYRLSSFYSHSCLKCLTDFSCVPDRTRCQHPPIFLQNVTWYHSFPDSPFFLSFLPCLLFLLLQNPFNFNYAIDIQLLSPPPHHSCVWQADHKTLFQSVICHQKASVTDYRAPGSHMACWESVGLRLATTALFPHSPNGSFHWYWIPSSPVTTELFWYCAFT